MSLGKELKVGIELEYSLLDKEFMQISEEDRDNIIKSINKRRKNCAIKELGASQIELRTNPSSLKDLKLFKELGNIEKLLLKAMIPYKLNLIKAGLNPFINLNEIKISNDQRYQRVQNFYNNKKRSLNNIGKIQRVSCNNIRIMGLANSVHINLQANSKEDAIDKCNRSLMIGPYIMIMAGNARYVELKDTGYNDIRLILWEKSHNPKNINSRIGLPIGYYKSIKHYLEEAFSYPQIFKPWSLNTALKLMWRDTRIKFKDKKQIVEFRLLSKQPKIEDDMALIIYYIGRLIYSQITNETLLPFNLVKLNKKEALLKGINGNYYYYSNNKLSIGSGEVVTKYGIKLAKLGLKESGLLSKQNLRFMSKLSYRLLNKESPSDRLFKETISLEKKGLNRKESLIKAMNNLGMVSNGAS